MPVYVYEVIHEDGEPGQVFEVIQKMSDDPLTEHPTTGQPVRRLITAPNLPAKWTESGARSQLSNSNLEAQGFTKYQKTSDGTYERVAGKEGPGHIDPRTI